METIKKSTNAGKKNFRPRKEKEINRAVSQTIQKFLDLVSIRIFYLE